ncbi:HAD family hydrolase [Helcobacillus massiliensis]|uniref:Cof-type HAD-IIB family hydrolase n=1 Tax=Helcobacillus massiliensis TaxID=521392 RepID=A0A839QV92_9MICO|nr:HAD family hydrolase [Helcobacillus massiliensis]MBB3024012.1 hypothetical protein [Helcobacillus massiliensis]
MTRLSADVPRPAAIATDLDGTLLRADGTVSDRTRDAFHAAWDHGLHTVLVTARPPRWVDRLADLAGSHGTIYCANGAFTYDPNSGTVTENFGFEPDLLQSIIQDLSTVDGIAMSAELPSGFWRQAAYPSTPPDGQTDEDGGVVAPLEDITEVAGKLLARCDRLDPAAFHRRIEELVGDRAALHVSTSDGLAELAPLGVSKSEALGRFVRVMEMTASDVWAFGDMPNDIPMLTWAGMGIAVANAHPDVLAVADGVTASNDEDGVAQAIEQVLRG